MSKQIDLNDPICADAAAEILRRHNRAEPEANITTVVRHFLTATGLVKGGVAPGASAVGASDEPLLLAFKTIFGRGLGASVLGLAAVAGPVASFHAIIYAYGRRIYWLSRAGYFPQRLSVTQSKTKTPHLALIAGSMIGYLVALLIEFGDSWLGKGVPVGAVLLNMAVFGAVIAYVMQMICFVRLRKRFPKIERPYISPLGNAGAIAPAAIAPVTLPFLLMNPDYRVGIYGCAVLFAVRLFYFAVIGRKRLVRSPEEDFALKHSRQLEA